MHGLLTANSNGITLGTVIAASLLNVWSSTWPYLVMILAFSVIVFVHELGHFAVAKWCGVRVDRFAIGFGRELFGFTRGETRYSFNLLPLGGYVKMLGQEDFDDKSEELRFKDDPKSFINKPVAQRMAIVSAGVVMNILFAFFLFMIVFLIGKAAPAPEIGYVEPDSPAQQAGLLSGDRVLAVNGKRIMTFDEVSMAVMLAPPHEKLEFRVERHGETHLPVYIQPESRRPQGTRAGRRLMIGVGPAYTREIVGVGPEIDATRDDRPHVGDILVEINGVAVTDSNINELLDTLAYAKGDVIVERNTAKVPQQRQIERVAVQIPPLMTFYPSDADDHSSMSLLGLVPLGRFDMVDSRGRAGLSGIEPGDTVVSWDDVRYPNYERIDRAVTESPERDIHFTVRKRDGRMLSGFVRPEINAHGAATIMAVVEPVVVDGASQPGNAQAILTDVRARGIADRAGIRSGDQITRCMDEENPTAAIVARVIRENLNLPVALTLRRPDGGTYSATVTPMSPGSIDATHSLIASDVMRVGGIVPTIAGRPSPAATAGIPAGARIVRVEDRAISSWVALVDEFRKASGQSIQLTYQSPSGGEETKTLSIPATLHSQLGVGPEATIVSIDGKRSVDLPTGSGAIEVSVGYHLGLAKILSDLVGQTGVPVEYRPNPLAPVETRHIDITVDMADPWLARVGYQPNVVLPPLMTEVRGRNALDAISIGIKQTYYFIMQVYETLNRMIFTRSVGVENISGPLGIVSVGGQIARMGLVQVLWFMALISANLAVINFLPLPIVDGGLMVFLIIEKIKGSPVSIRVQVATQFIGLALIVGAFVFVTYQDAIRLWG